MTLFKPVLQKKISDRVFEQLKELIFRGNLKPGDKLMPEREMADSMNVSRTTIRTAINRLVTMRLVEHKQGKGTFVAIPDPKRGNPFAAAMTTQDANIFDLVEVRMGLECNAAELAAKRADASDISALKHEFSEMEKEVLAGRLGTEADTAFHMAIAFATKNPLHIQVMKTFYDYLFHGIMENLQSLYEDQKNIHPILNQHKKIMQAIISRDPEAAFKAMQTHIEFIKTFYTQE
jgi:GntR family transcriptional repressor for pyruvate dehydrogenase complex